MEGGGDFDPDAAINALLADNLVDLVRFAYFITGNRDLADDVTAEAIERVLPHWRAGTVADRDEVWQALRQLSVEHRAIIALRYYEDLSEEAIAGVLGISAGTVKSRAHRGLKQLRRELARTRREHD